MATQGRSKTGKKSGSGPQRTSSVSERSARAKAARAAQLRAERRRRLLVVGSLVSVVILVIAGLVLIAVNQKPAKSKTGGTAAAGVVSAVNSVPASVFDTVGAGGSSANSLAALDGHLLTANGHPRVVYIGAEYCPYCAAERWPVTVALARFGTWSGLGETFSSASDVYPSTPTLSFHGATYTSKYLSFEGVEETTNQPSSSGGYEPLDTPTKDQQALLTKYDAPPYQQGSGSIPFLDMAGNYTITGAGYAPSLLAGESQAQVAAQITAGTSPQGKAIIGAANRLTAALCAVTKQQPSNVCSSSAVTSVAGQLPHVPS